MAVDPAIFRALVAQGASPEMLLAVVEADAAVEEQRLERKRANNAERQARYRARHADESNADNARNALQGVTECDSVTSPSLDKSPQTPKINPTPHVHGECVPARARGAAWACPEGIEPQHWRDFRANRRRKNLSDTETAFAGQIRLIERFASDEWPPGKLVQHAAEKGWGTIVDPSEYETPRNGHRTANDHKPNRRSKSEEFGDAANRLGVGRRFVAT